MRPSPALILLAALSQVPLVNCGKTSAQQAAKTVALIREMQAALMRANQDAMDHFTEHPDFKEMERIYGAESLDPGTPYGPSYQANLDQMIEMVLSRLDKVPKDSQFVGKASQEVRRFGRWWHYERTELDQRLAHLKEWYDREKDNYSADSRNRFEKGILVLEGIDGLLRDYETIVENCVRKIDMIPLQQGGW